MASGYNYFINPPSPGLVNDFSANPTFENGSFLNLEWVTSYGSSDLKIYQNNNPDYFNIFPSMNGGGLSTYNWTVFFYGINYTLPPVFFLRMNSNENDNQTFSSHYFNISYSAPSLSTSTSMLPSSTPPSTPNASTSYSTASPVPSSSLLPTNNNSTGSSSGLSTASETGIGIGASIGAISVLAVLGYTLYSKTRAHRNKISLINPGLYSASHRDRRLKTSTSIQVSAPYEMDAQEHDLCQ